MIAGSCMESTIGPNDVNEVLEMAQTYDPEFQQKLTRLISLFQNDFRVRQYYLEERIASEIEKRMERERFLQQQSKMAAMGEMMNAVAHQWKQPLNALSMLTDLLNIDYQDGTVDEAYVSQYVDDVQMQIDHMITTLNEFRTFFSPDKTVEPFGLKRCINTVMLLMKDELLRHQVTVHAESTQELIIEGIENEFKHLIINLINKAKETFVEREVKQRDLSIRFFKQEPHIIIQVEDNAGGIPEAQLPHIFKPDTTEASSTSIGMYMCLQIAEKMQGELTAANTGQGALYTLKLMQ